jgi:hypothetical protein
MQDEFDKREAATVQFIGVLDTIYKKLTDEERRFLTGLTTKARAMRQHAQAAREQFEEAQQVLNQTQMFLAVLVREHGDRLNNEGRATLRLYRKAFEHVKGDLEIWDEPEHIVLSYKEAEAGTEEVGGDGMYPEEGRQNTPPPTVAKPTVH